MSLKPYVLAATVFHPVWQNLNCKPHLIVDASEGGKSKTLPFSFKILPVRKCVLISKISIIKKCAS